MPFVYVASPYTHTDQAVMESRFLTVEAFTADQWKHGVTIYSPIVHCHEMARRHKLPNELDFWKTHNEAMLLEADALFVLLMDGWKESKGVQHEIDFAGRHRIPILFTVPLIPEDTPCFHLSR